ncbi:MAG: nucleotidyltransferase domain-containing protein [bacterium]|nr:nucleotidyltransferase domain-containing protein [bacterium]
MTREEEIKAMIKQTLSRFSGRLEGHSVILFGSRAGGEARPSSDFDIGIRGEKPLASETFSDIEDALESLPTLYKIELVDLNRVTPAFLKMATSKTEVFRLRCLHGFFKRHSFSGGAAVNKFNWVSKITKKRCPSCSRPCPEKRRMNCCRPDA